MTIIHPDKLSKNGCLFIYFLFAATAVGGCYQWTGRGEKYKHIHTHTHKHKHTESQDDLTGEEQHIFRTGDAADMGLYAACLVRNIRGNKQVRWLDWVT